MDKSEQDKKERNREVCRQYLAGNSLRQIGRSLGISKELVRLILLAHRIPRRNKLDGRHSLRSEMVGVNVSRAEKFAIQQEADRRGISMAELVRERLTK